MILLTDRARVMESFLASTLKRLRVTRSMPYTRTIPPMAAYRPPFSLLIIFSNTSILRSSGSCKIPTTWVMTSTRRSSMRRPSMPLRSSASAGKKHWAGISGRRKRWRLFPRRLLSGWQNRRRPSATHTSKRNTCTA